MLRRKLLVCLIAGFVAAATLGTVVAAEEGAHHGLKNSPLARLISGSLGRMMVLRSELDLSDQQRQQIHSILKGHRPEILKHAEALWRKRVALRDSVLRTNADEKEIRKAASDMAQQIGDAAVLAAKLRAEIGPVLDESQQKRVQKFVSDNAEAVEKFFATASKIQ